MKKKKRSLKKLSLNKKVVSNLDNAELNGGTGVVSVIVCPIRSVLIACPIRTLDCPKTFICPIQTLDCPIQTTNCSIAGCPIESVACPF